MDKQYNAVKIFSASKAKERGDLGAEITAWLQANPDIEIVRTDVKQSSDNEFHCLSVVIFYIQR